MKGIYIDPEQIIIEYIEIDDDDINTSLSLNLSEITEPPHYLDNISYKDNNVWYSGDYIYNYIISQGFFLGKEQEEPIYSKSIILGYDNEDENDKCFSTSLTIEDIRKEITFIQRNNKTRKWDEYEYKLAPPKA